MDIFAHLAAGEVLASYTPQPFRRRAMLWTIPFAMLPDLCSFGVYWMSRVLSGNYHVGRPDLKDIPEYVFMSYNISHSLVIALVVTVILACCFKKYMLAFAAWPLHILCDIPTHGKEFFATPLFYPLSDWRFDGWSFGRNWVIILLYWSLIALWIWWRRRQLAHTQPAPIADGSKTGTDR